MGKSLSKKQEKSYENSLFQLENYAHRQGIEVQFGAGYVDEIHEFDKLIRINSRFRIDQQVFTLAHELGHWLVRKDEKTFEKTYPLRALRPNRQMVRTRAYVYQEIKEEIEAWRRGKKLLERLGVFFIEKDFEKCELDSIYTYIKAA